MKKANRSTQALLEVKSFSRNGIETTHYGDIVYFSVKPTNISVLSRPSIQKKITHLMHLLTLHPDMEILCMDARENFSHNKLYLERRLAEETNPRVRELLAQDKLFLEDVQLQMSTSREFLFAVRLHEQSHEQAFSLLNQIEQHIHELGFECTRVDRDGVKRILCRYFGIDTDGFTPDDHDGDRTTEKWFLPN